MNPANKRNFILWLAIYITVIAIISSTIGRGIIVGKTPSLVSFSVIHFLGYLFFIILPVEVLFPYYLALGKSPILVFSLGLATAIIAQLIDYGIGRLASKKFITGFVGEKRYNRYLQLINKYGSLTIFVFNVLPLSSPVIMLCAGMVRFRLKKALLFSASGLLIKYTVIELLFLMG